MPKEKNKRTIIYRTDSVGTRRVEQMTAIQVENLSGMDRPVVRNYELWRYAFGGLILLGCTTNTAENQRSGTATHLPCEACFRGYSGRYTSRGECSLAGGCHIARYEGDSSGPSGHQNTPQEVTGTKT